MCGKEMKFEGNVFMNRQEFICNNGDCELIIIHIIASTEKSARKAWNKSLIGQLRKAYKKYTQCSMFWSGGFTEIMKRMFGGDQ